MGGFGMQWHQLDHMKTICTLLRTDNHTNTKHANLQVLALANWPARWNCAVDGAWWLLSGRLSELGGIVNLADWRRSSLSRSERPPFLS